MFVIIKEGLGLNNFLTLTKSPFEPLYSEQRQLSRPLLSTLAIFHASLGVFQMNYGPCECAFWPKKWPLLFQIVCNYTTFLSVGQYNYNSQKCNAHAPIFFTSYLSLIVTVEKVFVNKFIIKLSIDLIMKHIKIV